MCVAAQNAFSQPQNAIFDDKMLLDGYAKKFSEDSKEILLERIKDDTISPYMSAAAVRAFKEHFASEIFSREKIEAEKILLRLLARTESAFVEIEIRHTLCLMDRYKYFNAFIPDLIQMLDHYNSAVNELAYQSLNDIISKGHNHPREARIVFSALRKMFFLTRRKLEGIKEPSPKLRQKLDILKWSVKILGNQELKRLPREIIRLL